MMRAACLAAGLLALSCAPALAATPDGEASFRRQCGICHLEGGTGTFMLGRRLGADSALLAQRTNLTAPYVTTIVRRGLNGMPRFTRVELPDVELGAIARYLVRNAGQTQANDQPATPTSTNNGGN